MSTTAVHTQSHARAAAVAAADHGGPGPGFNVESADAP
jgi:hypothetical protein